MYSTAAELTEIIADTQSTPRTRRAIADLVRSIVNTRGGISRIAVVEWVGQFIAGRSRPDATSTIESVIDALCSVHDIGFGTVRGEPVLVSLPARRITLPDGRIIALGNHGIGISQDSENLFPEIETGEAETLIDLLREFDGYDVPRISGYLEAKGQWTSSDPIPRTLMRALHICGSFDPATMEWSLSDENVAFLNEWFGILPISEDVETGTCLDPSQKRVVTAPARTRLVVEAGPGSGKTHVACERVIALLQEEALAPSRILLLSFTRMAVAEMRARIFRRLAEVPNLAALQLRTFDSFAARILSASGASGSAGYDDNIRAATKLLRSGDPLVTNTIGQLEHVVIDEAQDLVGDRKAFCIALVELLHSECGITVLGDFAQAIYGYQGRGQNEITFLSEMADSQNFESDRLEYDHRTSNSSLRQLFVGAREALRGDPHGSRDTYFDVREQIGEAGLERDIAKFTTHPATTRGLILTRSRRALFTAAEAMRAEGRKFRMRLPNRPVRIAPWIGVTLGGLPADKRLSREAFELLHDTCHPAIVQSCQECWEALLELDGAARDSVLVGNVAEGLEDAPPELLCDFEGTSGPLLSTIHAVKGREDQRVMLLLTRAPHGDGVNWGEEARTLFVGATRSAAELRTAWITQADFYSTGMPERYWSPREDYRLIEIGLEEDLISLQNFLQLPQVVDPRLAFQAIWRAAADGDPARVVLDSEERLLVYAHDEHAPPLGCLSSNFVEALRAITQIAPDDRLPERFSGFSVVGATTVVVPALTGYAPTLGLMPLLGGFAQVPR